MPSYLPYIYTHCIPKLFCRIAYYPTTSILKCQPCKCCHCHALYYYHCKCNAYYCLYHFIYHQHNIVHYWKHSIVTTFDTTTHIKTHTDIRQPINPCAESISYGPRIFITGGSYIADVYETNLIQGSLLPRLSMPNIKCNHSLTLYSSYVYVVGGRNQTSSLPYCEKYNILSNKWTTLPNMTWGRYYCTSFIIKSMLFALLGIKSGSMISDDIEMHAIGSDKWNIIEVANKPSPRCLMQAIAFDDAAVVFGGRRQAGRYPMIL